MQTFDVLIIGGGLVGLALARALRGSELQLAVVESGPPSPLEAERGYSPQVISINPASQEFFVQLDVWDFLDMNRIMAYHQMHIWEKDSFARIDFNCQSLVLSELGYIIENDLIRDALWQAVITQSNVQLIDEPYLELERGQVEAWLRFERFGAASARLVVAADGAHSRTRSIAKIPLTFWDYQHHALVANILTYHPHHDCVRQIFTPEGLLALLPLPEPHLCSIIWSVSHKRAKALGDMPVEIFNRELMMALGGELGLCWRISDMQSSPLKMRYARDFSSGRVVLIGDAAHTIHPLAGQGINLGLRDVKALAGKLLALQSLGLDIGERCQLRDWERSRKTDAAVTIASTEIFKQLFNGNHPVKKLLRGTGMTLTDKLIPLKRYWMRQRLGLLSKY